MPRTNLVNCVSIRLPRHNPARASFGAPPFFRQNFMLRSKHSLIKVVTPIKLAGMDTTGRLQTSDLDSAVIFDFLIGVTNYSVSKEVDPDALIKISHAYGADSFSANTSKAYAAYKRVLKIYQRHLSLIRQRYGPSSSLADCIEQSRRAPQRMDDKTVLVNEVAFKSRSFDYIRAVWNLGRPGDQLTQHFLAFVASMSTDFTSVNVFQRACSDRIEKSKIKECVQNLRDSYGIVLCQ